MNIDLIGTVLVVIALFLRVSIVIRIRKKHFQLYEKLGNPHILFQGTKDHGSMALTKFLVKGEYLNVNDSLLQIMGIIFIFIVAIGIVLLVIPFFIQ